jgi:hypothetical protein
MHVDPVSPGPARCDPHCERRSLRPPRAPLAGAFRELRGSQKRDAFWFGQPPGCSTAHAGTHRSRREPGTPALTSTGAASARRVSTCTAFPPASGLVRPRCGSIRDLRVGPPDSTHVVSSSLRAAPTRMHCDCASFGTGPGRWKMCQVARVRHVEEGAFAGGPPAERSHGLMLPQCRSAQVPEWRAQVWIGVPRGTTLLSVALTLPLRSPA